ncbi:outer membrane beta-barrel protein [Spongiivirga citrea]|uniref:Outer membrane protein beta-barrel domain-containing protein n=1 Tax=Spongiivirga citrea TaxID=1481457 RepID=A0A6M0CMD3_9FLAO|nr:outer membrane beta-barrel protein [Spongiivirga citrea]NER19098.1 hypothetical protein [Spongiivirga citrea]
MGDKKHIDRLFQEKFKDFEVTPDNDLWNRIQDELGHKKKRRVIPFWMQLGGIAAALALLFMLGYNLFSGEENKNIEPQIVNEDVKKDSSPALIENENNSADELIQNTIVDENGNNTPSNNESEAVVAESDDSNSEKGKDRNNNLTSKKIKTNLVVVENKTDGNPPTKKANITDKTIQLNKNEGVAANNNSPALRTKDISKEKESLTKHIDDPLNTDEKNAVAAVVDNKKNEAKNSNEQNAIVNKDVELNNNTVIANSYTKENEGVKEENSLPSILDALDKEEQNTDIAKVEPSIDKKWSVNPMVAPVYYNTVGEGSPVHSQFKDNAKSGNINLSYGVGVAYQVSKRLSVRSGVNVVNLGYETEEIAFSASLDGGNLETISYNSNTSRLDVKDRTPSSSNAFGDLSSDVPNDVNTNRGPVETLGVMNQQFGYVEVPVELKYRLVDKKLGINVIGGLSSLFLTDNNISIESNDLITNVGEANNVNNMSFTTNVGIGIDYALSNNLQLNLEPIFKYQLNAFNREAGDFQPFYMGVYTGISFKF